MENEWEGKTDEEIARLLQEQFEMEDQEVRNESNELKVKEEEAREVQQEDEEEDEDTKLARMLQQEFDNEGMLDGELARQLQEEEEAAQPSSFSSFSSTPSPSLPPSSTNLPSPSFPLLSPATLPPPSSSPYPLFSPTGSEVGRKKLKEPKNASRTAIQRLIKDIQAVENLENPTIFIHCHENDVTQLEALIIGPEDTPYAGGMFHFQMDFPADYPWNPPKVELITTDYGRCRFNPNLYANGKVCLSILGTWTGPSWTAVQTCLSTLQSIQSLMNSAPYHNEPGYEYENTPGESQNYNDCITHETIRVAVCGMMEQPTCGNEIFTKELKETFLKWYPTYQQVCTKHLSKNGTPMQDPFGEERGVFQYRTLLERLERIHTNLLNEENLYEKS